MGGLVKHLSIIVMIKERKIIKDTGIDTYVYDKEGDKKQTRQCHYQFFAYRGSEE
jgi:hypothetical protein